MDLISKGLLVTNLWTAEWRPETREKAAGKAHTVGTDTRNAQDISEAKATQDREARTTSNVSLDGATVKLSPLLQSSAFLATNAMTWKRFQIDSYKRAATRLATRQQLPRYLDDNNDGEANVSSLCQSPEQCKRESLSHVCKVSSLHKLKFELRQSHDCDYIAFQKRSTA